MRLRLTMIGTVVLSSVSAQATLEGRWLGGIRTPGDYLAAVMTFERNGDELTGELLLPNRSQRSRVEVAFLAPDVEMEAYAPDGTLRATLSATLDGDVLLGRARRAGGGEVPLELVRVADLRGAALDSYCGEFRTTTGQRITIDRLRRGTDEVLVFATESGIERILFPRSATEWTAGPEFEAPVPVRARITFTLDDAGAPMSLRFRAGRADREATRLKLEFDHERIERRLQRVRRELDVPSISVGIVHGEELAYAKSIGVTHRDSGEPATPDTLYQIASVTKTFTATLLTILRDEGELALDDPVAKYLPDDVELPPVLPAGAPAITLRHLVTHTSGLPQQPHNYVWEGRHNNNYTVELLYAGLPTTVPVAPIDAKFSYSNQGYVLLGHALARAGGASFEQLLKRKLFAPLGMDDSTITLDDAALSRLATHYWSDDPKTATPPWIPGEIAAQGGLTSSVRDMAKYLSLQFRSNREDAGPLAGASLREIQRPQRRRSTPTSTIGYGWFIVDSAATGRYLYHSGFTGGNSSWVGFSPAHRVGIVVLVNFGFEPANRLGPWLLNEAVRTARAQRFPTRSEALGYTDTGDWSNAAWAHRLIAERDESGEAFHRLAGAQARVRRFVAASESWQRAAELGYSPGPSLYNAGTALAVCGEPDDALDLLRRAIDAGYTQRERFDTDANLDTLRDDARFIALIERL